MRVFVLNPGFVPSPRNAGDSKTHAFADNPGMTPRIPTFVRSWNMVTGTGTTFDDESPEGCILEAFSH